MAGYLRGISHLQRKPLARKILLADDSVTAQNMGRKILADAGYEVITVNNGSAALKRVSEQRPDLIVLDVYMPGYSGLEVCQRLKETSETSRIPIILTVGKLEPFKPEESKRVRADGFIVKPFEASELLSALTKLEDKIVPRSEPSKPGRFARATAALEDVRYDKATAFEEDAGWKNRLTFPSPKKKSEEDKDESANYDVLKPRKEIPADSKPTSTWAEATVEDTRLDLAALAPEGLPKDVTPEEIAALAAAAAQMKGNLGENKPPEPIAAESRDAELPAPVAKMEASQAPSATLAEQNSEAQSEAAKEIAGEASQELRVVAPHSSDVAAALAGPETPSNGSSDNGSGNGPWPQAADRANAEPVTMAVAAAAAQSRERRWTAVPVTLAPEEASISLEHEMQKTYAAYAAAESTYARSATSAAPAVPTTEKEVTAPSGPQKESPPVVPIPATPAPEAARSFTAVASISTEAVTAAVKELEKVAASLVREEPVAPAESKPVPEEKIEPKTTVVEDQPSSAEKFETEASGKMSQPEADLSSTPTQPIATVSADLSLKPPEVSAKDVAEPISAPQDATAAAMSVAAGSEKAPEAALEASEESGVIASIVDSVLADMRPKIVAEISRKLGKKK
jgi:CheY-like chemotaxis protein